MTWFGCCGMVAVLHRNLDQGVLMPAEHRPDPIQPEPSHLVDAALLLGFASSTSHHPRLANAAAIRALSLVGNEVMLDLIDRCEVQMRAVATDLGVEFLR